MGLLDMFRRKKTDSTDAVAPAGEWTATRSWGPESAFVAARNFQREGNLAAARAAYDDAIAHDPRGVGPRLMFLALLVELGDAPAVLRVAQPLIERNIESEDLEAALAWARART